MTAHKPDGKLSVTRAYDGTMRDLVRRRLVAQQIARHDFATAHDLVAWLGCVQAQDWGAAKWALGLRLDGATDASIERAVSSGEILRTHALRGTWQLMAPADVRWIVELVGPRVIDRAATRHRALGLTPARLRRSIAAIVRALRTEHLTRDELGDVVARAGVSPKGQRLPHILVVAELAGAITSGAWRGKQPTWALLDRRAPRAKSRARRDAVVELAVRHLRGRGPATADDFVWWSGLPAAEAREGFAAARELVSGPGRVRAPRGVAHLLPAFDEWLIGYRDRSDVVAPDVLPRLRGRGGMLDPVVVVDGMVVGTWSRTVGRRGVTVRRDVAGASASAQRAIEAATARYERFLGT